MMTSPANAPQQIGKYRITGEIGRGGMGVVYKAVDPYIQRTLAIKTICIHTEKTDEELKKWKTRFLREARLAGKLSHPNIVTIHDVGEASGLFYIAMEYVEGRSLRDVIDSHEKLSFEEIQGLLEQICDAISYAHDNNILHCDIKPDNILVDSRGNAAIVDFGIARTTTSDLTSTLSLMVTPSYAAPERISGKEVGPSSDVFSIAATVYELMTGEKPFPGDNISTVIKKILYDEPPEPTSLSPELPDEINAIISKALAKEPEDRYRNCRDFYGAIADFNNTTQRLRNNIENKKPKTLTAPTIQVFPQKHRKQNHLKWALSVGMVLLIVGLGAFFYVKKTGLNEIPIPFGPSQDIDEKRDPVVGGSGAVYSSKIHTEDEDVGADKKSVVFKNAVYKIGPDNSSSPSLPDLSTSEGCILQAKQFLDKEDYDNAVVSLKKGLALAPDNYNAHYLLGSIFKVKENYDEAVVEYKKALSIEKTFSLPYKALGEISEEKGETEEALSYYQKYCDITSDEANVREVRERMKQLNATLQEAKIRSENEKARMVAESLKKRQEKEKKEIDKYFKKGVRLLHDREFSQAVTHFRKILALDPEHKQAKSLLKQAQGEANRKKNIDQLCSQGVRALKKGDYPGAKSCFTRVLKLDKAHASAKKYLKEAHTKEMITYYFTNGVKAYNEGDYEQTMVHFREVLKLDSNHEEARRYIKMAKLESMDQQLEEPQENAFEQSDAKLPKGW
ncbi:MAG: protein kinase [Thermodesulfobacteriota bacterium]|nr:protein kinase [Thermodesulfobacteriota bacterium]